MNPKQLDPWGRIANFHPATQGCLDTDKARLQENKQREDLLRWRVFLPRSGNGGHGPQTNNNDRDNRNPGGADSDPAGAISHSNNNQQHSDHVNSKIHSVLLY